MPSGPLAGVDIAPVGEPRVSQARADGHHAPMADVSHVGYFTQALDYGVVMDLDEDLVSIDAGELRGQRGGEAEVFAFPIAGKILTALQDGPVIVDQPRAADAHERRQL